MDSLERLEAIEAIRTLKSRYFRALDGKDWDLFGRLFTDDGVQDMSKDIAFIALIEGGFTTSTGVTEGGANIAETVGSLIGDAATAHTGCMDEIVIDGPTRAHGIWSMTDYIRYPGQAYDEAFEGTGNYHEDYECIDGEWRIAKSVISHLIYRLPVVSADVHS